MSTLFAASIATFGCDPGGDEDSGGTTVDPTTTGQTLPATTSTTTGGDESTGSPPGGMCMAPAEIPDAPPADCSGASRVIEGSVFIEAEGGDDPASLADVVEVTGEIRINRSALTDLNFMACVKTVGDSVTVFGNENLTNVDGLWSLEELGTEFVFSENGALTDFNGLPNLRAVNTGIIIKNNDSLETITGFQSLVGIEGSLTIQSNNALTNIDGLGQLRVLNGVLSVTNNDALCLSSVNCVGTGITQPSVPPDTWSTQGNNEGC